VPVARTFNGSSDQITLSISTAVANATSGSMFVVVKRANDTNWNGPITRKSSGGSDESYLDIAPSSHATNNALWSNYAAAVNTTSIKATAAEGWLILGATKAAGSATVRHHKYVFGTSTWSHADVSAVGDAIGATGGSIVLGNVSGDFFAGDLDVAAFFTAALSDANVETLDNSLSAWDTLTPAGMWVLDQASTATAVTDRTGNGANQTAISGTSVAGSGSPLTAPSDTTPPSVPTGLHTTAVGSTTADLAWTASTDDVAVTGYEILVIGP